MTLTLHVLERVRVGCWLHLPRSHCHKSEVVNAISDHFIDRYIELAHRDYNVAGACLKAEFGVFYDVCMPTRSIRVLPVKPKPIAIKRSRMRKAKVLAVQVERDRLLRLSQAWMFLLRLSTMRVAATTRTRRNM